jgi:plastocyanin
MATAITTARPGGRGPVSALGKTTIAAMVGIALLMASTIFFFGFDVMTLAVASAALIVAVVVAFGFRWAPLLATLAAGALLALFAFPLSELLSQPGPKTLPMFVFGALVLLACVIAVSGGVAATLQNYRLPAEQRRAPRALPVLLTLAAGLLMGAVAVAAIPRAGGSAGVSPEILAGLQQVPISAYEGGEIRVRAGELVALRMQNPDPVAHSFDVDELNVHAPMPAGEETEAIFKAAEPGEYRFYCAPHYDKASGQGMYGTLIVEE